MAASDLGRVASGVGLTLALLGAPAASDPARGDPPPAWAGELALSAGLDVSRGDYGEPVDTTFLYAPVTLSYLLDDVRWTADALDQVELGLTVPWVHLRGPEDFFAPTGDPFVRKTDRNGLGDVVLRGTYLWYPDADGALPLVELTTRFKIPTADEDDGLGTGEPDLAVEVALSRSFGRLTPYAVLGYRFVGEPPGVRLDDAAFASLGAGWRLAPRVQTAFEYGWIEASSPLRDDAHELLLYAAWEVRERLSIAPYAVAGLAGDGPDWAVGLTFRWSLPVGRPR